MKTVASRDFGDRDDALDALATLEAALNVLDDAGLDVTFTYNAVAGVWTLALEDSEG